MRCGAEESNFLDSGPHTVACSSIVENSFVAEEQARFPSAKVTGAMLTTYRIQFRGPSGEMLGRADFQGEDDRDAMVTAALLYRACSDLCDGFELWQAARRVDVLFGTRIKIRSGELNAKRQEAVAESEERLRDSHWAIAKSKRLLEQLRRLVPDENKVHDRPEQGRQQRLAKTLTLAIANARPPKQVGRKASTLSLKPIPDSDLTNRDTPGPKVASSPKSPGSR